MSLVFKKKQVISKIYQLEKINYKKDKMVLEFQKKVDTKFLRITLIFDKQTVEGHSINQEILTVCIFPHHFYHIDLT